MIIASPIPNQVSTAISVVFLPRLLRFHWLLSFVMWTFLSYFINGSSFLPAAVEQRMLGDRSDFWKHSGLAKLLP